MGTSSNMKSSNMNWMVFASTSSASAAAVFLAAHTPDTSEGIWYDIDMNEVQAT